MLRRFGFARRRLRCRFATRGRVACRHRRGDGKEGASRIASPTRSTRVWKPIDELVQAAADDLLDVGVIQFGPQPPQALFGQVAIRARLCRR